MKKFMAGILIGLCVICSVLCSVGTIKAKGAEENITTSADAVLSIEDEHVYSGMDRAYKDGYEPIVAGEQDGKTEQEDHDAIQSEQVDDQQQPEPEQSEAVWSEQGQSETVWSEQGQQSAESTEEKPTSEPKVIIEKTVDMPERIESGSEAAFQVVLKNTNKKKYVQNMTVTVNCEEPGISLLADSNVFYFEKLGCQATLELPLRFQIEEKTAAGKYPVTLEMSYDNPDAVSLSSVGKIELKVSQKMDVSLEVGDIAESVNAGDSVTIPIQAINMGRGSIYNVRCRIEAAGLTASTSLFLGNVEAGSAAGGELNVFADMVFPEADTQEQRYGYTSGSIILTYEDENGNEYREEQEISTTVNPLVVNTSENGPEEESPKIGLQMAFGAVILCSAAAVILLISLLIRQKRAGLKDE